MATLLGSNWISLSESSLVRSFVCLCLFTCVAFVYFFCYLYCYIDIICCIGSICFDIWVFDCKPCGKDFLHESRVKT